MAQMRHKLTTRVFGRHSPGKLQDFTTSPQARCSVSPSHDETFGPDTSESPSERRLSPRAPAELPVSIRNGVLTSAARSVDVSTGGILLFRSLRTFGSDDRIYLTLELTIPGEDRPLHAVARPIWSRGPFQALKFVQMSDVDRLSLAEHVDRCRREARS